MERLLSRTMGLGPLEPLMEDPAVDEIMVNGQASCLSSAAVAFDDGRLFRIGGGVSCT